MLTELSAREYGRPMRSIARPLIGIAAGLVLAVGTTAYGLHSSSVTPTRVAVTAHAEGASVDCERGISGGSLGYWCTVTAPNGQTVRIFIAD